MTLPARARAVCAWSAHRRASTRRFRANRVLFGIGGVDGRDRRLDEARAEIALDPSERLLGPMGEAQLVGRVEIREHLLELAPRSCAVAEHVGDLGVEQAQ